MSYLTISRILEIYKNIPNPDYVKFIDSTKKEVEQTKMYKLMGVLNIELDTELTEEIIISASELYENTLKNTPDSDEMNNWIDEINYNFNILREIIKNNSDKDDTNCCGYKQEKTISGAGRGYICYNGMDDNNKKAMDIQAVYGWDAAIKHMITGSDGKPRSYAEMRELYG
jgi:hypothetical protein